MEQKLNRRINARAKRTVRNPRIKPHRKIIFKINPSQLMWCAQFLAHFVTIIGGGAVATTYVITNAVRHETSVSEALAGPWSNIAEGCIGCRYSALPSFSLELEYKTGVYSGYIDVNSYAAQENNSEGGITDGPNVNTVNSLSLQACCISLKGRRFFNDLELEIYDLIAGERTVLGYAVIKKYGADYQWVLKNIDSRYARLFPKRAWIQNVGYLADSDDASTSSKLAP